MIASWAVALLCIVGALCVENEPLGKLPRMTRTQRPSLGIFGGNKTSVAKYPYIASLEQGGDLNGAAVVLNKHWLLTTAWNVNYVSASELSFRVGSNFYDKQGQVLTADKVIVHPSYTGSWDWDIAVVKTDKPIKLGKKVKAVALGTKKLAAGTKAMVAGWGEYDSSGSPSENLLDGEVTVLDWNKCAETYGSHLTKRLMCSFDKTVAPCFGDFAVPLVVKGAVYGLFAGGFGCEPDNNPLLYTDIPSLYKWVQSAIKDEEEIKNL